MSVNIIASGKFIDITAQQSSYLADPINLVDSYGAVGDGVTDDTDAIRRALDQLSTITGTKRLLNFSPSKTYLVKDTIELGTIGSCILAGYGATIKRGNQVETTLSNVAAGGASQITVSDASLFSVGERLCITDTSGTYGGIGISESSLIGTSGDNGNEITDISGNVITFSETINLPSSGNLDVVGEFPIGAPVFKVWDVIKCASAPTEIYGLTFDGNKDNNTGTVAWTANGMITNMSEGSIVSNCTFINMPSECLFFRNQLIFTNNFAQDCNGSVTHLSDGNAQTDEASIMSNNIINNVCLSDRGASLHSEAVFVASASTRRQVIIGNTCIDCNGYLAGDYGAEDDYEVIIKDNTCINLDGVIFYQSRNDDRGYDVQITNNYFKNCRTLKFGLSTSTIPAGGGIDRVQINDNMFINTQIEAIYGTNIQFENNQLTLEEGYSFPANSIHSESDYLVNVNGVNISVLNNIIDNRRETEGDFWKYAIFFNAANSTVKIKTDASTETDYSYQRNCNYNNNVILGFSSSFNNSRTADASPDYSYQGVEFSGNLIVTRSGTVSEDAAGRKTAVKLLPGMICKDNKIYGGDGYGVWSYGVSETKEAVLNAPITIGNIIVGFDNAAYLGRLNRVTEDGNCIIFKDNYISSSIADYSNASNSMVSGNTTIIAETPRLEIVRINPEFY